MGLRIYNYLTREKEPFEPLERGRVGMYVCGPTVYDDAHLGHAKLYVSMDVVVRYLRYLGNRVRYVQNITDVGHLLDSGEDRIMKGARREQIEPMEVVEKYMRNYFRDMDALGVARPDISPRASGHVIEQIEVVKILLEKGYAYETESGDVYFSVEEFPEYARLSHRDVDEMEAGARVEVREEKRHPADFALWKHAEPEHLMRWPSPWGEGYPGWHLECTAMATKYLGETFDIHGGGVENMFPHNDCEIAQAEAMTGEPFARYWILVGSLNVNGVKMSKSLGNFLTIQDTLELYSPETIRFFILSTHYRSTMDFSREAMLSAQRGVERLHNTVLRLRNQMEEAMPAGTADLSHVSDLMNVGNRFMDAMNDDFNTPQAIAALFDFNKQVNELLDSGQPTSRGTLAAIDGLYRELGGTVLGIIPDQLREEAGGEVMEALMEIVLQIRQQYREEKAWEKADQLRDRLDDVGIVIEDRPEGPTWRLQK